MSCCKPYDPCRNTSINITGSYAAAARQWAEDAKKDAEIALQFNKYYLGPWSYNPPAPEEAGVLYYNTTYKEMVVWTGTEWCSCKDKLYMFALDSVNENVWYRGYILKSLIPPPPADPYLSPLWEIEKTVLTIVGGNEILTTTYATGAWNNRESLIYT